MKQLRFGIDVDGVLYHFHKTAVYMLNSQRGYSLDVNDWSEWDWLKHQVKNNDYQWLWSAGVKNGLFRYGHMYKGAIEGLHALSALGDVVIITHRPKAAVQDTMDWLSFFKMPVTEVYLMTEGQAKSAVKCDLYVDDKVENIKDYLYNTKGVALLWDRPWNHMTPIDADCSSVEPNRAGRVNTWEEVVGHAGGLVR